jgi:hypothetical protein
MSDQPTRDLESRLAGWLTARAPADVPPELRRRVAGIPAASGTHGGSFAGLRRPDPRATRLLLLVAMMGGLLAATIGGILITGSGPWQIARSTTAPLVGPSTAPSAAPSATIAPSPLALPSAPAAALLPAVIPDAIEHGTIDTPIGPATWVHLHGDRTTLPDPLTPQRALDGRLLWFGDGISGTCSDPALACSDRPKPNLTLSNDLVGPRETVTLPDDASVASLWIEDGAYWYSGADDAALWTSTDLTSWRRTDLSGLRPADGPAGHWGLSAGPAVRFGGTWITVVGANLADQGALLGHPGRNARLAKDDSGGWVAKEYRSIFQGGDIDLGSVTVRATAEGLTFLDAAGRRTGFIPGADMGFADRWAAFRDITRYSLAVLEGDHWVAVDVPDVERSAWPSLGVLPDGLHLLALDTASRVHAWRSTDGRTWTGGDVPLTDDGTELRSNGAWYDVDRHLFVAPTVSGDTGWVSTDGVTWSRDEPAPEAVFPGPALVPTGLVDIVGARVSRDGVTWEDVPALTQIVSKTEPNGAGGSSMSVLDDVVFYAVDEDGPGTRDLWMLEFRAP